MDDDYATQIQGMINSFYMERAQPPVRVHINRNICDKLRKEAGDPSCDAYGFRIFEIFGVTIDIANYLHDDEAVLEGGGYCHRFTFLPFLPPTHPNCRCALQMGQTVRQYRLIEVGDENKE
jgi:hypothetical protein